MKDYRPVLLKLFKLAVHFRKQFLEAHHEILLQNDKRFIVHPIVQPNK